MSVTTAETPSVNPRCWDGFMQSMANRCKCDDMTSEKVAQVAGIILAVLAVLIFVSALMVQYPMAAKTFFTLYGLGAITCLVTMVVAIVKYCKDKDIRTSEVPMAARAKPPTDSNSD